MVLTKEKNCLRISIIFMCPDETEGYLDEHARKKKKGSAWEREKYR